MAYDRADWHYGGDFPDDLPREKGGTHVGMFLSWALRRGLAGELHREGDALARLRSGELTGCQFLFQECDEKFTSEDLNEEGVAFTESYYDESYLDDYVDCFDEVEPTIYHVPDTPESQARVDRFLDERFRAWKGVSKKPWWKLW